MQRTLSEPREMFITFNGVSVARGGKGGGGRHGQLSLLVPVRSNLSRSVEYQPMYPTPVPSQIASDADGVTSLIRLPMAIR